jgi:hypothetical protein
MTPDELTTVTASEASLGPPRWAAGFSRNRRGWLLVEKRSEPALR